jgi:hypothetical protein
MLQIKNDYSDVKIEDFKDFERNNQILYEQELLLARSKK